MLLQKENVPNGHVIIGGQSLALDDLARMQGYCTDCLFMDNCRSASAIDGAVKTRNAPGIIEHMVYVRRADTPDARRKLICLRYENVTHAHR